jgi:hypothetical protein
MSVETVYSCLIDSAVVFLGSWLIFLLAACARVFRGDAPAQKG